MPARGARRVRASIAPSAVWISRWVFCREIFLTSTSRALPRVVASRSSRALASSVSARFRASWRSWYSRRARRSLGTAAAIFAFSSSERAFSTANFLSAEPVLDSAAVRWSSLPASEAESRFSSRSEANCELSNSTTRSPALTAVPSSASQRIWSWNWLVRGTARGSPRSASSSRESSNRWRKVPRWATSAPASPGAAAWAPSSEQPERVAVAARVAPRSRTENVLNSIIPFKERIRLRIPCPVPEIPFGSARRRSGRGASEVDLGRGFRSRLGLEVRLGLEAEHPGEQRGRELAHPGVVLLGHLIERAALDGDAVLRPLELHHQVAEAGDGLEVRVALHHHHEAGEGRGQAVLGLLELLELLRIVEDLLRRLGADLADAAARLHHLGQRRLLEVGGAFDARHQVRNQVRPPLIDVLHLPPLRL